MTDKERIYRNYAADDLMDAAKRAYGEGEVWYIRYAIQKANDWLDLVEKMEKARIAAEEAARVLSAYTDLADAA